MIARFWRLPVAAFLLAIATSLAPGALFAQPTLPDPASRQARYVTNAWTVDDGLPLNVVWALTQTSDGALWIGTLDGLARFDGHAFTTYHAASTPGLAGNRVVSLLEDADGTLWIATQNGASTYRDGTFERVDALPRVEKFALAPDGTVWIAGRPGFYRTTPSGIDSVALPMSLRGGRLDDLAVPASDSVWIAVEDRLVRFHDGRFASVREVRPDLAARLTGAVQRVAESPSGTLWVGTRNEIVEVRPDTIRRYPHDGDRVQTIRAIGPRTAWVTTVADGLLRVRNGTLAPVSTTPALPGTLRGLIRDDTGQWWVGSHDRGLFRLRTRLFHAPDTGGEGTPGAHGVYGADDGSVYVGVALHGLCRFQDDRRSCFTPANSTLPESQVWALQEDAEGTLWASTTAHLVRRENGQFRIVTAPDGEALRNVSVLYRDAQGTLWIGADEKGLFQVRNGMLTRVLSRDRIGDRVQEIRRTTDGSLWLGTQAHGLARWDGDTLVWYDEDDGLPYTNVRGIHETDDGTLWVATAGGGVARFEGDGFTPVTPDDGLPHRSIHTIREGPQGAVWMTSNDGVFRMPREGLEAVADGRRDRVYAQAFGVEDGLPANECNGNVQPVFGTDGHGRFWIPTVNGPAVVDPQSSRLAIPDSLPVQVTAVRTDGVTRPLDSLSVPGATRRIAIDFTVPSLRHASDLSFRYRLGEGAWTPAQGRRTAEYTNLPPGNHEFTVQATIDGSRWYSMPAPLRLTVQPQMHQTWWFRALVGLMVLGASVGAYRWRVHRLTRRQEQLEARVQERTSELAAAKETTERQAEQLAELDAAKNRFFAHVSHEFRTPLSLLMGPLDRALDRGEPLPRPDLRRMRRSASRLQTLIDRLLDLATLDAGAMTLDRRPVDVAALVAQTVETFRPTAQAQDIALIVDVPAAGQMAAIDREKIVTVISNLVDNAIAYTPEGGRVAVQLAADGEADWGPEDDDGVTLTVTDTGRGIASEAQDQVFDRFARVDDVEGLEEAADVDGLGIGLALTRELVELHGGSIRLDSTPGAGSAFCVRLPRGEVDGQAVPTGVSSDPSTAERTRLEAVASEPAEREGAEDAAATLLIAEDNDEMRDFLRMHLEGRWAIREAEDGDAAWEALQEDPPDLLISDVMMPGRSGVDLCRAVKADPELRVIPVILLTARARDADTLEGLEAGADAYVAKPFNLTELERRIENQLARSRHLRDHHRETTKLLSLGKAVDEETVSFLERVTTVIEDHLSNPDLTVDQLADAVALSRRQLNRRLKDAVEETPAAFVRHYRIERAKSMLKHDPDTIAEVAYAVGFRSPSHFSQAFKSQEGLTPSAFVDESGS